MGLISPLVIDNSDTDNARLQRAVSALRDSNVQLHEENKRLAKTLDNERFKRKLAEEAATRMRKLARKYAVENKEKNNVN